MAFFAKSTPPAATPKNDAKGLASTSTTPPRFDELPFPEPVRGFGNTDRSVAEPFHPEFNEQELIKKIDDKVAANDFELPHLAVTHMRVLDMTSNPEVDVTKVERMIAPDLALAASLLKIANSVMYGGARQVDTIRGAILRIGIRGLRSSLLSLSLKSVIFKCRELSTIAEEVWRQSFSIAGNARSNAVPLALDPERMYVLGLLHDIGKVPLLHMLRELAPKGFDYRRNFVGHVFHRHHESVGLKLAQDWNLPDEVVAVAGCHHDFAKNPRFTKSAALVCLSHKQDIHLSCGDSNGYFSLAEDPSMQTLELPVPMRRSLLDAVRVSYMRTQTMAVGFGG